MNKRLDLSSYDNSDFEPGSFFLRFMWLFFSRAFLETRLPFPSSVKVTILRLFGANVGQGVIIKPNVKVKYPWFLEIGNACWVGEQVWIDNLCHVRIADNCCLSQGAYLLTGNHDYTRSSFELKVQEISIGEGVWVGARVVVCPGIDISPGAVLCAGSVVAVDCLMDGVYQGNPATLKKVKVTN